MPYTLGQFVAMIRKGEFDANLARVRNLIAVYRNHLGGTGARGRRAVHATDVLRSAVVLLHATLEELLRGIAVVRIAAADESVINSIPLAGLSQSGRAEKFFLGKLVSFREKKVDDVISESVRNYFHTAANFNNTNDIALVLQQCGIDPAGVSEFFPALTLLLERRHHIVHRADLNPRRGSGEHQAKSLGATTVEAWAQTVAGFGDKVLELLAGGIYPQLHDNSQQASGGDVGQRSR